MTSSRRYPIGSQIIDGIIYCSFIVSKWGDPSMAKQSGTNEELFLEWLKGKLSGKQISDCYLYCLESESLLKRKHWIRSSFFEIDTPDIVLQMVKLLDDGRNYSSTKKEVFRQIKKALTLYLQFLTEKPGAQVQSAHRDGGSPASSDAVVSQKSEHTDWIENEKKAFMEWQRAHGQAESNVTLYAQAVEKASQFARQLQCKHSEFYCADTEETGKALAEIRLHAKFNTYNQGKSFIFTRAIKKYMEFQQDWQRGKILEEKSTRVSWTKYEAAVLLDGCIKITNDESCRSAVIKRISKDLRQMAVNNGLEIDDIYRNVNGIQFQMKSMESAFWGKTIVKPSSALFREVMALYRENRGEYDTLLAQAQKMITGENHSPEDNNVSTGGSALGGADDAAISPTEPVIQSPSIPQGGSRWEDILREYFSDGYILDDFISQFQAGGYWTEKYGEPCPLEGQAIDEAVRKCGTIRDGRVYPKNQQEGELMFIINSEIQNVLETYSAVYLEKVYEKYQNELSKIAIYSQDVLASQLLKIASGKYRLLDSHVFAKPYSSSQVTLDCERVLQERGGAQNLSEISNTLWFLPYDTIYQALNRDKNILNVGPGEWMLIEHFPMTPENAWIIGNTIEEAFLTRDFLLADDLMALIEEKHPSISDDISGLSRTAQFNILAYYLGKRFTFSASIVAPLGMVIGKNTLFAAYPKDHPSFTMEDLDAFASELKAPIYWDTLFDNGVLRIQKDRFVRTDQVKFDIQATDKVLETICDGDYTAFSSVPSGMLALLPSCGMQWNQYLLFSYVRNISRKYYACYNNIGKSGCYGAIVRRDSEIKEYAQLIERVLIDSDTWKTDQDALNLLVNEGYQASKQLKGIGDITQRARKKKLMMGEKSRA